MRRRAADVLSELPEKKSCEIWLDLTDEQREAYDEAFAEGRTELSQSSATRVHVFSWINKLKQICNLDPRSGASCKLDYLVDQLEGVTESGQKALVFSHFPQVTLSQIKSKLARFAPEMFDGTLADAHRERLLKTFQEESSPKILLASVKAGGLGLTLTRANHVFHFDHWWNPAVARQAEGRAHRIGQTQTVFVYDIFTNDTIEDRIYQLLAGKQYLFDTIIDDLSVQHIQDSLTDDDLFGLFDLKPPESVKHSETSMTTSRISGTIAGSGFQTDTAKTMEARETRVRETSVGPADKQYDLLLANLEKVKQKLDAIMSEDQKIAIRGPITESDFQTMTPASFESLIASLYVKMGFMAEVTPQTHDGGVDVIARRLTDVGQEHLIIQCKHYPDGVVGESHVRDLVGTWQEHRQATRAVLVTSGRFSSSAVKLAQKHRVDLIDGVYLRALARKYGLP